MWIPIKLLRSVIYKKMFFFVVFMFISIVTAKTTTFTFHQGQQVKPKWNKTKKQEHYNRILSLINAASQGQWNSANTNSSAVTTSLKLRLPHNSNLLIIQTTLLFRLSCHSHHLVIQTISRFKTNLLQRKSHY